MLSFGGICVSMGVVRHPASYSVCTRDTFPGGKATGAWSCTPTPQYVLMVWCLFKRRDNFTFTLP